MTARPITTGWVLALGLGVAVPAAAGDVSAGEPGSKQFVETTLAADTAGGDRLEDSDRRVEVIVGLRGGVTGATGLGFEDDAYVTDADGNRFPAPGDEVWERPEYYSHIGVGATTGPTVEVRYDDKFGLETGLFYSRDRADGYVDKMDAEEDYRIATIHSEQRTSSVHLPVLLKAVVPGESVRPFVAGGVQFVAQSSNELDYRQEGAGQRRYATPEQMERLRDRNQIETSNYLQAAASAGVELVAGQVTIPVELRVGYTPGAGDPMQQRARAEDGRIVYDGVYMGHFGIFAGALYEFDFGS